MTRAEMEKLLDLPTEERLELAQILWDSIAPEDEAHFLAIPAWQREILDDRLDDLARNPEDEEPWEQVKAELRLR